MCVYILYVCIVLSLCLEIEHITRLSCMGERRGLGEYTLLQINTVYIFIPKLL